jgi:hypothetical protein
MAAANSFGERYHLASDGLFYSNLGCLFIRTVYENGAKASNVLEKRDVFLWFEGLSQLMLIS